MDEKTDQELVESGRRGDSLAIGQLFERHYKTSLSLARRILSSDTDAQDAVQGAFCSAFQHLDSYRGDATFKTWITRIVVNRCLMVLREPWRRVTLSSALCPDSGVTLESFASHGPSPEKLAWRREIAEAHDGAMSELPNHLRSAYSLYAMSGLTIPEVASTLGISAAATKSRVFRARNFMRTSLETVWSGVLPDSGFTPAAEVH